mgnify:CR=1 FL=1
MFNSENCWDILDTYFQKGGSPESSNPLVKHQIDSYNKFIDNTLGQIIAGFNPIKIKVANPKNDLGADNTYCISINILEHLKEVGVHGSMNYPKDGVRWALK